MVGVNLKRREKFLWIVTLAIGFLWAWKLFVLGPIFQYRDALDVQLGVKNIKLREARKTLIGSPQASQESLRRFVSEGSSQADMARMIKDVESAAALSGIRVLETKPQPQVKNIGWNELRVSIAFEGSWNEVVTFLFQLENVEKPLLVNDMSVEANLPQQTSVRGRLEIGRIVAESVVGL